MGDFTVAVLVKGDVDHSQYCICSRFSLSCLSRFFRNQEHLKELRVQQDLAEALRKVEALILAVPHAPYRELSPDWVVKAAGGPLAVVDCFGILDDARIRRYFELGCEVKALGRGHVSRLKKEVLKLGRSADSTVPNRRIGRIDVDRSMGLTLHAFNGTKVIHIGYGHYPEKYRMLATILARVKRDRRVPDFSRIDLQDINRIVIRPVKQNPSG